MGATHIQLDHGMAVVTPLPVPSTGHIQELPQSGVRRALLAPMEEIPAGRADEGAAVRALLHLLLGLDVPRDNELPALGLWAVPAIGGRGCVL